MKRFLLIGLVTISSFGSDSYDRGVKNIFTIEYQKLNDTLDIFDIKGQELGKTLSKYASIGNMDGYKISLVYGYSKDLAIDTVLLQQRIEYGSGTLVNNRYELSGKYTLSKDMLNGLSTRLKVGMVFNDGNELLYSDIGLLNDLGHKISDNFELMEKNSKYLVKETKEDGTINFKYLSNKPYISITNMEDESYYLQFDVKKILSNYVSITPFVKFNFSSITTDIRANDELVKKAMEQGYDLDFSLNRDEKSINLGFELFYHDRYSIKLKYYYTKLFRADSENLNYIDYNHVINLNFIKPLDKKRFIYIGGKYMHRQFNGEIPYLYNKYSQTTFDHRYGFARVGFGLVF